MKLVGIGYSAGEGDGLGDVVESLPDSLDLSYVMAQSVSATQLAALTKLLATKALPQLKHLEGCQVPEGGIIYLPPPQREAVYLDGALRLVEPSSIGESPANRLFNSLAVALGREAVGIVLSGIGSDGAIGLRNIRAAGGVTLAQEPRSVKYDGMPKTAIRAGSVDLVFWPRDLGPALLRLLTEAWELELSPEEATNNSEYRQIVQSVRFRTAVRLDEHPQAQVMQRIARRVGLLGLYALEEYTDYLKGHSEEAQVLVRDIFLAQASPFHDTDTYRTLKIQLQETVPPPEEQTTPGWVEEQPKDRDDARY